MKCCERFFLKHLRENLFSLFAFRFFTLKSKFNATLRIPFSRINLMMIFDSHAASEIIFFENFDTRNHIYTKHANISLIFSHRWAWEGEEEWLMVHMLFNAYLIAGGGRNSHGERKRERKVGIKFWWSFVGFEESSKL